MQDRVKSFKGVTNFRDFGGYPTRSGGRVKKGHLYRSAHFGEAHPEDLAALDEMGIGFVVDLRRNNERRIYPTRWPASERPHLVVHDSGEETDSAYLAILSDPESKPSHVREHMRNDYGAYPFKERYAALYSTLLKKLAAGHGPVLVHCMAGKDRTGVACALVLKLLGVSDDDVLEDYLLTNRVRSEAEFEQRVTQFAEHVGRKVDPELFRAMWMVDADYLASALDAIKREHGSVEVYAEKALNLTKAERDALLHLLVET